MGFVSIFFGCFEKEKINIYECETFQLRCEENFVQICNKFNQWESIIDCSELESIVDGGLVPNESFCCCFVTEEFNDCDCVDIGECNEP